jgi:hypothetical protein
VVLLSLGPHRKGRKDDQSLVLSLHFLTSLSYLN